MAHAYQNVSSGQIVVSDEPRPDLEALARWKVIPVPEAAPAAPPASTPPAATGDAAGSGGDGSTPTGAETATGETVETDTGTGAETGSGSTPPVSEPVPDESWTHEQLDALAEKREIKFPSNTNKAAKVAALTAPAGE
ncbi:hypothetical protein [uncultured Microbacterium sp.]|uniref:hypothetical protein n=1 Tax=uncultured Microbacterium sp. TaxID=191216 RepID=UPI0025F926CA|nr:hypothetical protein [uncultured Microbacterium sp.]